ncbi:nitrate- and nitrite sensing domain-containing protein, partial [Rhizobiaceae sp. 2RAB30]
KELSGQERAIGSAGFAARQFTPDQRSQMVALIAAQEQSFITFREIADSAACETWQPLAQASRDIERLRRNACTGGRCD